MNAAAGIVITVTNVFRSFVGNITTAFRPQIIKLYAQEKYTEMMDIYYLSMRMLIIRYVRDYNLLYLQLRFYFCESG